ncbi:PREDICTED: uncharacterized protein LOC108377585 [Rhagoletis zephyria]|uniref:uncharacterized protein LOC108377585 n=1 Tax=Rhagoletis zephyria TaxID=28612 RepID=UPI0008116560|nr:PREDICTED: uncharacterized protein LOC108377585 [Rhagoletis zephyria]
MKCRCIVDFIAVAVVIAAASGLIIFAIAMQNSSRRVERKLAAHETNLTKIAEQLMFIGTTKPTEAKLMVNTIINEVTTEVGSLANVIENTITNNKSAVTNHTDNVSLIIEPVAAAQAYEERRIRLTTSATIPTTTVTAVETEMPAYITTFNAAVIPTTTRMARLRAKPVAAAIVAAARAASDSFELYAFKARIIKLYNTKNEKRVS